MIKIVGIRFKPAGKIYDFDAGHFVLRIGDHVIVETQQGLGLGMVVTPPMIQEEYDNDHKPQLKKVYRLAVEADFEQLQKNLQIEQQAYAYCERCIEELSLDMHLFQVESTFDGSKLTFYFTSENRVDFRQLIKMLVKELGVRIDMRQVGIRNQAKMCGGIGRCGREICCSSFLNNFSPVSIRMAKEQGLSLNPAKISGLCGRLMCCLTYEVDTYRHLKADLPKMGKIIPTPKGPGKVIRHNPICGRIGVRLEDGTELDFPLSELSSEQPKESS
jgi:cell fate regulator YaaT (PSP1 superfamily)